MFENLEILQLSGDMARHAARRQTLVARNIANADTPGYRPLDIGAFAPQQGREGFASGLRRTRDRHLVSEEASRATEAEARPRAGALTKPNGNAVSLQSEMVTAAELRQRHSMALSVYGSTLDVLRASLGKR